MNTTRENKMDVQQQVSVFVAWAAATRRNRPTGDPGKTSGAGFLTFSDGDKEGVIGLNGSMRFESTFPGSVETEWLGKVETVREWADDARKRAHVQITDGPLSGLQAIIDRYPTTTSVFVFTNDYLEADDDFATDLAGEIIGVTKP